MEFEQLSRGNKTRKAILYEQEFCQVIAKFNPRRPVAVLAIAGKANKGKSLFLSYVLRYLKAQQDGNPDWMGWNDATATPLDGFKWGNGYEVLTKGIWIWSEPITCKNSRGQEFEVLLMDTQGVFDEKSGQREWNILAGLGLLTSSIMVLNTSNDVQEDTLASFENFLSFGRLALDQDESRCSMTKPFQTLVFLVRDWENHIEYPFGHEGGRRFIQRKLMEKPDHDDFHRRLRRNMRSCFEHIDCFLLPHPGLAAREPKFTASVVNASPEFKTFAAEIQLCIEQLANPNHFPLKTLNGNVLTATELFSVFKSYVDIFNSDELPSSNDFFNAAAEQCNAVIISRCLDVFVKNLESSLSSVPFLSEKDFQLAQEAAEEEAGFAFGRCRQMGDKEAIAAAQAELRIKLEEKITYYRIVNHNKHSEARQQFETKVQEILADYETEMESKVGEDVLYEHDFEAIHNQVTLNARQKIENLKCVPSLEANGLSVLSSRTQNTQMWLHRVKLNRERVENSLRISMADAENEYRNSLDPSNFTDVEDLKTAEIQARSKALEALKIFHQQLSESTLSTKEKELTEKVEAIYGKALENLQKMCESQRGKLDRAIEEAAAGYKAAMDAQLFPPGPSDASNDKPVSIEDLETLHNECESKALKTLSDFFRANSQLFKNPNQLEQESTDKLRSKISEELAHFRRLNHQKIENLKAEIVRFVSEAQQEFTEGIKVLCKGAVDENDVNLKASGLKIHVKSKLEAKIDKSIIDDSTLGQHLSKLDSHMDTETEMWAASIRASRKETEMKVKTAMVNAKIFYKEQLMTARGSKSWLPVDEFKRINDQTLEDTVRKYTDPWMTSDDIRKLRDSLQLLHLQFEEENDSFIPTESYAIGIDLGTTYSCVGLYINGKVDIIQENERFTIPSCVYYEENDVTAVGEAAQDGAYMSPENFIFDAKRLIGRNFVDDTVQDDINHWSFNVVEEDGQPRIQCRAGILRPEQVSAEVLLHLKSLVEKHLGQTVTKAVVTVPAYFNEGQRQATKDAAAMAGLEAKILTEPVAAAIAYRMDRAGDLNKNILVFDLGGGTFDVAVLNISGGHIDVKTINGDTHLGGEDFDKLLLKHVVNKVKAKSGRNLLEGKNSSDPEIKKKANNLLRRLKIECERRKRDLSSTLSARIRLEEVGWNLDEKIMRAEFEQLIKPDLEKCMKIVERALVDAKMSKEEIHDIVLVGGSTKIPRVQEMLKEVFSGIQLKHTVHPDQAVACGAAIQAAIRAETKQAVGLKYRVSCQDVTPSSIGIEEANGTFIVQVPKGSAIPYTYQQTWFPERDNQPSADFVIYEGEEKVARNNRRLGKFILHLPSGIKMDEGQMESTTMVDEEGILTVKATCLLDGNQKEIRIQAYKGRMSQEDMENSRVSFKRLFPEDCIMH